MATPRTTTLPQGFSVYQPMLGAPLQFFPAVGTKELDDMLDAFVAGPGSIKEKRATVSVDFLEYTQRTGQVFKFYEVVGFSASVAASPSAASVSSLNASPVTSNWDWSSVTGPAPSRASTQGHTSRKASTATASSRRHSPTDFSHLPGMKILTKDGMDVTNAASRGSKTKEQRDHAHLMRIIKACDSCKKKKIRCDPSHKKRAAASQAQAAQPAARTTKKSKSLQDKPSAPAAPVVVGDSFPPPEAPSIDFDSSLGFPEFESFDATAGQAEPWEEFIQYPPVVDQDDYDFFFDPQGFLLPQDQQTSTSSSVSPFLSASDTASFSQTMSSSGSPDFMDYALLQTSTSTSPELGSLDGYDNMSDAWLSTADVHGGDRHVLPQYPMPPSVPSSGLSIENAGVLDERVSMSSNAGVSMAGQDESRRMATWLSTNAPLVESMDPRDYTQSLESIEDTDRHRGPVRSATVPNDQTIDPRGHVQSYSQSPEQVETIVPRGHIQSSESRESPEAIEAIDPRGHIQSSQSSEQPERHRESQGSSEASLSRSLLGRVEEHNQALAIGSGDYLRSLVTRSPSEGVAQRPAGLESAEPADSCDASSGSSATELYAGSGSPGGETASPVQVDPTSERARGYVISRTVHSSRTAPLSSRMQDVSARPEHEAAEHQNSLGSDGVMVRVEASGVRPSVDGLLFAADHGDSHRASLAARSWDGLARQQVAQVESRQSDIDRVLPGRNALTGTDCVLDTRPAFANGQIVVARTSTSTIALGAALICAALELFTKQRKQQSKERKVDSWMAGLMMLIPMVAFAFSS